MAAPMDKWKLGTGKASLPRRAVSGFAGIPEDDIMTSSKDEPVSMPKRFLRRLSQVTGIERPAMITEKLLNPEAADDNVKQALEMSRGMCLLQDSPLRILRVSSILTTHERESILFFISLEAIVLSCKEQSSRLLCDLTDMMFRSVCFFKSYGNHTTLA